MTDNQQKARVLVVGTGIGAMCSYALDQGGKAEVTAVLRSNYDAPRKTDSRSTRSSTGVFRDGGRQASEKPSPASPRNSFPPSTSSSSQQKHTDIPPPVSEIIAPAVTPGHSVIILAQNGLNLERRYLRVPLKPHPQQRRLPRRNAARPREDPAR
ncbi:hypothetical protein BDW71DRAFT_211647 [Aspergillus fruticulosus]